MVTSLPIRTSGMTLHPMPSKLPAPIVTLPASPHCGAICTARPIRQLWSTVAPVLMMAKSSMTASALMIAPAMTATPSPNLAEEEMMACGLIAFTSRKPSAVASSAKRLRSALEPTATKARE